MKWHLIHYSETIKHKAWVTYYLLRTCMALVRRAILHDCSKFSRAELDYFVESLPRLRGLDYGSQEYKDALKRLGPALTHHYQHNSHHPEFHLNGIQDMTPLDILEMLCDWRAATKRHANGNYEKSLELNMERFGETKETLAIWQEVSREIGLT